MATSGRIESLVSKLQKVLVEVTDGCIAAFSTVPAEVGIRPPAVLKHGRFAGSVITDQANAVARLDMCGSICYNFTLCAKLKRHVI